MKIAASPLLRLGVLALGSAAHAAVLSGADISSLPDIEQAGGIFRDHDKPADEIAILRSHGCDIFRVRLFVNPDPTYDKSFGATQNIDYARELGRRIKAAGGTFLLDIHYSDTWADPSHQHTPKAWKDLSFDALKTKVAEYTTATLADLQSHGAAPDMVQVGNEITSGMLWPAGQVWGGAPELKELHWTQFAQLVNAGTAAVRQFDPHIRIVLHVDGGGHPGRPMWVFDQMMKHGLRADDFDIIGLSFYPAWKDDIVDLKKNMAALVSGYGKDILLAETGYAWAPVKQIEGRESMSWPQTPQGQLDFLRDTRTALAEVPGHHGLGFVWWYSDAIPVRPRMWREGNEAVFDHQGNALPVLSAFKNRP